MFNLNRRLVELKENVGRIDKAIDELLFYSFQYNLKIVGVPQVNEKESSEETAELCIKLFSGIGVDVTISDIDIAHGVTNEILRTVMATREDNPIQSSASLQEGWYVTRSWLRGITSLN